MTKQDLKQINAVVVISDIHAGCRMGLCPPGGVPLDDGGMYMPSTFQLKLWAWWREFWDDIVPDWTRGEPYAVVFNGDAVDGVHHKGTTQISHNLEDQLECAYAILKPIADGAAGYYHIRGTETHVGPSAREEERLAKRLGAIPNGDRQSARYNLWKTIGSKDRVKRNVLLNFMHHIGTTGSMAFETTAVMKELVEAYSEAGRWGRRPPDAVIRSHRHRCVKVEVPTANSRGMSVVTPAWQGKTPFVWRIPGGRQSEPQVGGLIIRVGVEGEWYCRPWVKSFERAREE